MKKRTAFSGLLLLALGAAVAAPTVKPPTKKTHIRFRHNC